MEIKKNPKSNLENFSKLFVQLGLVLTLFLTYVAMENKTFDEKETDELAKKDLGAMIDDETLALAPPPPPPPPPANTPPPPPPPTPTKFEEVEDDSKKEETVIQTTETDETEEVKVEEIEEVEEVEEVEVDVPFAVIEEVPVYPGCTGSRKEKVKCLNSRINSTVLKAFDTEAAIDAGVTGSHRIFVKFKIDKTGKVSSIQAIHKNKTLKKLAEKAVRKLPKMKPGRQRSKPVNMPYVLPISFTLE